MKPSILISTELGIKNADFLKFKMKILFFWFNFNCQSIGMNIGVSILSKELQEAGHRVKVIHISEILDYPFDVKRIIDDSLEFNPDVFALSFGSNHYFYAMQLAKNLKKKFPDKLIICGGIHTTLNPEEVINENAIDIVAIGEVDGGHLVSFIEKIQEKNNYKNFSNFWIKEDGSVYKNKIGYLPDITNQTFLNFDLIDYKRLTLIRRGFIEVSSSRGCFYKCSYCQNHAIISLYKKDLKKFTYSRQRTIKNLIEEIKLFLQKTGDAAKAVIFADDTFIMNKKWIGEFSENYSKEINLPFSCCGLVNLIDDEMAEYLSNANCMIVRFGVETGSEKVRFNILNKPIKNFDFEKAVNILRKKDINIGGYVMIGIPGEKEEDILTSFKYFSMLKLDEVRCSIFYPYENTKIYKDCETNNLIDENINITSYHFGSRIKWDNNAKVFLEKANSLFPLIVNMYLENSLSFEYKKIVDKVFTMSEDVFKNTDTKRWLHEVSQDLSDKLKEKGEEHYFSPFPDRPDAIFLFKKRTRKLVNIDG